MRHTAPVNPNSSSPEFNLVELTLDILRTIIFGVDPKSTVNVHRNIHRRRSVRVRSTGSASFGLGIR